MSEQLDLGFEPEPDRARGWQDDPVRRPWRPVAALREERTARSSDPDTSREGPVLNLTAKRRAVLKVLEVLGPMTDSGIAERYDAYAPAQSPSGLRTRRSELVVAEYVIDSGERQVIGGRRHIVWSITDAGREALS